MKRLLCLIAFLGTLVAHMYGLGMVEFGLGSGMIFYGDDDTNDMIDVLSDPSQVILDANVSYLLKLADPVYFSLGADSAFDFRWSGGKHVYLLDYAGLVGFRIYPGLAGLTVTVDYALGRRTDVYNLNGNDEHSVSTKWGNGFKCGIQYDFGYKSDGIAPVVGFAWRRMPRGNAADNILSAFLKLTIK